MTTAFIRSNAELNKLLDSWLVKYSADQPRDPHGRWTADGGGEQVHDPVRVRRAAINTAVHAVASAAALANALASAGGLRQAPGLLEAVAHAGTLAENLRELRDRSRETYTHGRELAVALGPQMRQLRPSGQREGSPCTDPSRASGRPRARRPHPPPHPAKRAGDGPSHERGQAPVALQGDA